MPAQHTQTPAMQKPPRKPRARSGWSDERRARHAAAIRKWKPWAKSTGPKTASGKAASAQNACKHGERSAATRLLHAALSARRHYVRAALVCRRLKKIRANELLKRMAPRLRMLDRTFHVRLAQSIKMADIMQKSCIFPLYPPNS